MNSSRKIIILLLATVVVMFLVLQAAGKYFVPMLIQDVVSTEIATTTETGILGHGAPSGVLVNMEGKKVDTAKFLGQPMVLVFWAIWNSESVNQLANINAFFVERSKFPANLLIIASQQHLTDVRSYMKRGGYTVPIYLDEDGSFGAEFGVKSLPVTYFVDVGGIIKSMVIGDVPSEQIANWLAVGDN